MRRYLACLAVILAASCGGGSPTSPTPTYPMVAGSYTGSATFNFTDLQQTVTCPASTSVTQSGASVTIAPLVLAGACGNTSVAFGQVTIDTSGMIVGNGSGSIVDPTCGTVNTTQKGGFSGRDFTLALTFSVVTASPSCPNFNVNALLTRS